MTALTQPRAGARVHLVAHRVNGAIAAYQQAGARWRLWVTLDDGATVTVGADEARYVDAEGRPGDLVMPPAAAAPTSPPAAVDTAAVARTLADAIAAAEQIAAGRPTHGSVTAEVKRLAALALHLRDLAEGLLLGSPLAQAMARDLFTPPRQPPVKQGVTTHG